MLHHFDMFFVLLSSLILTISSYAYNTSNCIRVESRWGQSCNSSRSLDLVYRNVCGQEVYLKSCIQKTDGGRTYTAANIRPGGRYIGSFACSSTGRYEWNSCTGGRSECGNW